MEKFYTPKEIAPLLKVSIWTVWRWIRNGQLKAVRALESGSYRIEQSALDDFMHKDKR